MVLHPSAFVFLSESRTHGAEVPFYGASPTNEFGTSHCSYAMESSRHNAGANLTFLDGHIPTSVQTLGAGPPTPENPTSIGHSTANPCHIEFPTFDRQCPDLPNRAETIFRNSLAARPG